MAEKGKSTYYRSRELLVGAISYIVLIILSIFFFYPIFWMVDLSIMPKAEVFRLPPRYLVWPSLSSYIKVVTMWEFTKYLMNSVITSSTSVILSLLLGVPCAYVISRYDFPGRQNSAFFILSFRFLPPVAVAIPFYILYTSVGLFDTITGLVLFYIVSNLPYVVWLMKGFFDAVPVEVEEAAEVDGYSKLEVFYKVTLPLVYKGLAATTMFCLLLTWNEFAAALILTGTNARTLPVQALQFVASLGLDWGALAAASMIISLPMMIFGIIIRNHLIRGLTFGAVR